MFVEVFSIYVWGLLYPKNNEKKNTIMPKSSYRPEIDGLRAVAIIVVIINHFNQEILPSGYLGVDIFFVISGFVITSSLATPVHQNLRDFLIGFYSRRVKRLVPALVLFVCVTSLLICVVNPFPINALITGVTALFGISNLFLFKQSTNYFAESTELNPFTHTWSLGVEEQFYILFPILTWLSGFSRSTKKGSRNLGLMITFLSIVSWISFQFLAIQNQPAAYFLMTSRFWELGIGCLLFLLLEYPKIQKVTQHIPPFPVIGLLVVVLFFPYQPNTIVSITTIVVFLTGLLLSSVRPSSFVYSMLTQPQVVRIGRLSYSLYLWHWGILSLSRWTVGIQGWSVPVQLVLVVLFSIISYKMVERPLRHAQWSQWRSIGYGGAASVSSAVLIFGLTTLFPKKGETSKISLPALFGIIPPTEWTHFLDCHGLEGVKQQQDPFAYCLKQARSDRGIDRRLYLLGDSHAAHLVFMTQKALHETQYQIGFINTENQADFPHILTQEGKSWRESITLQKVIEFSRSGDIVAIAFHRGQFNDFRDQHVPLSQSISQNLKTQTATQQLSDLASTLHRKGIRLLLLRDIPLMRTNTPSLTCALQSKMTHSQWNLCKVSLIQDTHTRSRQDSVFNSVINDASVQGFKVFSWDPREQVMTTNSYFDAIDLNGNYIMWDSHHITREYSQSLSPAFKSFLIRENLF
jgi:peptidoglycan/LPS O-acetylase OafA/YrhL